MSEKPASSESSKFKANHNSWFGKAKAEAGPVALGGTVGALSWYALNSLWMFNPVTAFLGAAVAAVAGYKFYKATEAGGSKK